MFTGIIESIGTIQDLKSEGKNIHYQVDCDFRDELKVDQSIAHDGVCLTVTHLDEKAYWVTAINETLEKTNLSTWKLGTKINLERCMPANGRFDGHIVQGHVDQVGKCTGIREEEGSWFFDFEYDPSLDHLTVEKGSITINGISLTCFNSHHNSFSVAIIPYTYAETTMNLLKVCDQVNLEFDIIGKYVKRLAYKNYELRIKN